MCQFFRDFIVVIVLMSIVFGCGKAPSTKEEAGGKTLTFWHIMNYSGPKEVLEGAVKRFEAAHPDVKVVMQTFENDAYKVKLANEMASGNSPDVFFTWGAGGQTSEYIRQGKVLCLNEYAKSNDWEGRFIDSALSICRNGGDLYSVPLDLSAVTLWCNKKLFDENGLAYPKTFEELVAVSTAFRAKKITPLALGNMKKWPGAFYFCYLANRCGGTQLFLDAAAGKDGAAFDDVAFVTAGKMLRQLIDANAFSIGFNGKFKDGQPFAPFYVSQYTDGTHTQTALVHSDAKGINMYNQAFGKREDAFFNLELRATGRWWVRDIPMSLEVRCYNIYDFGTALTEYTFDQYTHATYPHWTVDQNQPTMRNSRTSMSLCIPRGLLLTFRVGLEKDQHQTNRP